MTHYTAQRQYVDVRHFPSDYAPCGAGVPFYCRLTPDRSLQQQVFGESTLAAPRALFDAVNALPTVHVRLLPWHGNALGGLAATARDYTALLTRMVSEGRITLTTLGECAAAGQTALIEALDAAGIPEATLPPDGLRGTLDPDEAPPDSPPDGVITPEETPR